MKYLRRLPWQVQFALFAPFLLLFIFVAVHGGQMYRQWSIRWPLEQALATFDPETTAFTIFAADWLNGIETHQKTSAQLTAEQRQMVGKWIAGFRYARPYSGGYSGGDTTLWVEFQSPYGFVDAHYITSLKTARTTPWFCWLIYHDSFREILFRIKTKGLSATETYYIAEFDTSDGNLHDKLWEMVIEEPLRYYPPFFSYVLEIQKLTVWS